ncbi:hypothetical protein E9840_03295 [Tissierella creatinini]|nr:hypothetical protein E9840_03295 [Tissierella creatinini]TJX60696.1 hypothetical protein E8P77_19760 [Soehngenia saccharolytica]
MSITTIKRRTGWQGRASKIQIRVNGEKVASISHNQHIEVDLPAEKVHLKVTQFGVKSNEIEVKDGDVVEITPTLWYRLSYQLFVAVMIITLFIPNSGTYRSIVLIILSLFLLICSYIINGFTLNILDSSNM